LTVPDFIVPETTVPIPMAWYTLSIKNSAGAEDGWNIPEETTLDGTNAKNCFS